MDKDQDMRLSFSTFALTPKLEEFLKSPRVNYDITSDIVKLDGGMAQLKPEAAEALSEAYEVFVVEKPFCKNHADFEQANLDALGELVKEQLRIQGVEGFPSAVEIGETVSDSSTSYTAFIQIGTVKKELLLEGFTYPHGKNLDAVMEEGGKLFNWAAWLGDNRSPFFSPEFREGFLDFKKFEWFEKAADMRLNIPKIKETVMKLAPTVMPQPISAAAVSQSYLRDMALALFCDAFLSELSSIYQGDGRPGEPTPEEAGKMLEVAERSQQDILETVPEFFEQVGVNLDKFLDIEGAQKMVDEADKRMKGILVMQEIFEEAEEIGRPGSSAAVTFAMQCVGHGIALDDDQPMVDFMERRGIDPDVLHSMHFESPHDKVWEAMQAVMAAQADGTADEPNSGHASVSAVGGGLKARIQKAEKDKFYNCDECKDSIGAVPTEKKNVVQNKLLCDGCAKKLRKYESSVAAAKGKDMADEKKDKKVDKKADKAKSEKKATSEKVKEEKLAEAAFDSKALLIHLVEEADFELKPYVEAIFDYGHFASVEAIEERLNDDDAIHEIADGMVDIYTGELIAWYAESISRLGYADAAMESGMAETKNTVSILQAGQFEYHNEKIQEAVKFIKDELKEIESGVDTDGDASEDAKIDLDRKSEGASAGEVNHYEWYVMKGAAIESGWEYEQDAKDHVQDCEEGLKVVKAQDVAKEKKAEFHKRNKNMDKLKK